MNRKHPVFKEWIRKMKTGGYDTTTRLPIIYLTKTKDYAYSPIGVLFKVMVDREPERYMIRFNGEGRAKNGGYKICTMYDATSKRTYLTTLPPQITDDLSLVSGMFALYMRDIRAENLVLLEKRIVKASNIMAMDLDTTVGQFEALNRARSVFGFQRPGFFLSDLAEIGLDHRTIGTLLSTSAESATELLIEHLIPGFNIEEVPYAAD